MHAVSQPVSLWNDVFTENLFFSSLFLLFFFEFHKVLKKENKAKQLSNKPVNHFFFNFISFF